MSQDSNAKNQTNRRHKSRGVAAVEFAFIAPALIVMLFGGAEAGQVLAVDRKVTQASSALGDLAAQDTALTCAELDGLFAAAQLIMQPYPTAGMQLKLSQAVTDGSGNSIIEWSRTAGCLQARVPGTPAPAPSNLIAPPNGGVIVAELTYPYSSGFTELFIKNVTLSHTSFLLPRRSEKVCFEGVTAPGCT
jgi:Flp pilus assembly protein TadG